MTSASRTKEFDQPGSYRFLKCITVKSLELDLFFGIMAQTDSYISLPTCLVVTYDVNVTYKVG